LPKQQYYFFTESTKSQSTVATNNCNAKSHKKAMMDGDDRTGYVYSEKK